MEQCIIPTGSADGAFDHSECKDLLWVRWGGLDYDGCILAPVAVINVLAFF